MGSKVLETGIYISMKQTIIKELFSEYQSFDLEEEEERNKQILGILFLFSYFMSNFLSCGCSLWNFFIADSGCNFLQLC